MGIWSHVLHRVLGRAIDSLCCQVPAGWYQALADLRAWISFQSATMGYKVQDHKIPIACPAIAYTVVRASQSQGYLRPTRLSSTLRICGYGTVFDSYAALSSSCLLSVPYGALWWITNWVMGDGVARIPQRTMFDHHSMCIISTTASSTLGGIPHQLLEV